MYNKSSFKHIQTLAQANLKREQELIRQTFFQAHQHLKDSNSSDAQVLVNESTVAEIQNQLVDTSLVKRCLPTKKDKNAPRRNKNAYMFWCEDNLNAVKEEFPDYKMGEVAKELGARWKKVKSKDRAPYQKKATADKKRFQTETKDYESEHGVSTTIPLTSYQSQRKTIMDTIKREKQLVHQTLMKIHSLLADGTHTMESMLNTETITSAQESMLDSQVNSRLKEKKDTNAPKGIRSAYVLWCKENRASLQEKHPECKMGELSKKLGNLWKTVEVEVKEAFKEKSAEDKIRYETEMAAYNQKKAEALGELMGEGSTNADSAVLLNIESEEQNVEPSTNTESSVVLNE